jgi:hypothetical protein
MAYLISFESASCKNIYDVIPEIWDPIPSKASFLPSISLKPMLLNIHRIDSPLLSNPAAFLIFITKFLCREKFSTPRTYRKLCDTARFIKIIEVTHWFLALVMLHAATCTEGRLCNRSCIPLLSLLACMK